eukprot:Skav211399  [mRNA]  locus=scaffold1528:24434:24849:+ [translate_table: standard]
MLQLHLPNKNLLLGCRPKSTRTLRPKLRVCLHIQHVLGVQGEEMDLVLCSVFGMSQLTSGMRNVFAIIHADHEV